MAADEWGVDATYLDSDENPRTIAPETVERLRSIVGRPPADLEDRAPIVLHRGDPLPVAGDVVLEDGDRRAADAGVTDLPLGYHTIDTPTGRRELIVTPGTCRTPQREWGWAVQLYAARSRGSWGLGSLAAPRPITDRAHDADAGFVLINPLHAPAPVAPLEPSPYFPSTRRHRNPLYLQLESIPGVERIDLADAQRAGRALNDRDVLDRDALWRITRPVLQDLFSTMPDAERDALDAWRSEQSGAALEQWSTWCALADAHGARWREWPTELRSPTGDGIDAFAREHAAEIGFHDWLQWQVARQLEDAAHSVSVIQDLPIGFDPDGADAWAWQDMLAFDATVGAPPDTFNTAGQNWGLPPFVPWRLRQAGYTPFAESIRATMTRGGGLRIDHIMGLFRLWWIPAGDSAADGGYVRYPAQDLVDIITLEAHRADAFVVGEDLGTVEDGVRETMADAGMLSYRLLYFEENSPAEWPTQAMAAVNTHDLPTVAGLWTGDDLRDQQANDVTGGDGGDQHLHDVLADATGADDGTPVAEVVRDAYAALAGAPSLLISASLDDAAGARLRPNMPGATSRDNWSIPLPAPLEDILAGDEAGVLSRTLDEATKSVDVS